MARLRQPTEQFIVTDADTPGLPAMSAAADELATQLIEIDKDFADAPYSLDNAITEAKFFINQTAGSIIEAGKRLLLIKEHEGHGGFIPALEQIGIDYYAANRLMKVALKFGKSNIATLQHLNFSKGKFLELAVLDDEEIEGLGKGETVRGLKLDEVDKMSVRELRAALRKEQADRDKDREDAYQRLAARQKILDDKNRQLDEMAAKLNGSRETDSDRRFDPAHRYKYDVLHEMMAITAKINSSMVSRLAALKDICGPDRHEEFRLIAGQVLGQIMYAARATAQDFDVLPVESPVHAFREAAGDDDRDIWDAVNAELDKKA